LLRLIEAKFSLKPSLIGGQERRASPAGGSIFSTSAPMSASSMPQKGPAATEQNSITRTPARGRAVVAGLLIVVFQLAVLVCGTCGPYSEV